MADAECSILLVLGSSTGGIGKHVASLSAECLDSGYRATVCGPQAALDLFEVAATGATVVPLPVGIRLLLNGSQRRSLRRLLRSQRLVHVHGLQAGVAVVLLASRGTVVSTWHNAPLSSGPTRWLHRLLERLVARRATVIIGASEDLVVRARRAGAADVRFVPVAPPRLAAPTEPASLVREGLGLGDAPIVLAVGRLHKQKRFDVLVAAAAGWQAAEPTPVVLIAGEGPEREALERQVSDLQVDVRLLGQRSDIANLLSIADVVVLPSSWEARPLAAQEALLAGRALVATAVGGVPSMVGPGAVLVPVGSAAAITAAVSRLLTDPASRHRLEQQGLARAAQWPDEQQVAATLMDIYAELLAR